MKPQANKYSITSLSGIVLLAELIFWGLVSVAYYILSADDDFRIENPSAFWFFILIPAVIASFYYFALKGNISIKRLSEEHLSGHITKGASNWRMLASYFLLRFGIGFLIIALSNPQHGKNEVEGTSKGIEIMIALDVSNSMLARDLSETRTRLNIAKLAIERLTTKLHGDKMGIVVFAGSAYTQLPITSDYNAAKLFLSGISTDMMSSQGTAVGAAIDECLNAFDLENGTNKAIIIISDGENHEEGAIEAASYAANLGIQIHTIGMGTSKGTPIELYRGNKKTGVKKDKEGNTVITQLNEDFLIELGQIGNGTYTRANKSNVGLGGLLEELKKIDKTVLSKERFLEYDDHFQLYLFIGLMFVFSYLLIPLNSNRNVELNLFEE